MARRATAVARPAPAPRHAPAPRRPQRRAAPPRRVSGAARVARLPLRIVRAPAGQTLRARLAGIADSLLHGRGWIALVAVLLVGIVFFNVDLLQMNRDIARTAERSSGVKHENARLKLRLARLASTERIQRTAQDRGLLLPQPGQIRYLRANGVLDGRRAARRIVAPGEGAPAVPAPTMPTPPVARQPTAVQQEPAQPQPQAQTQPQAPQPAPQAQPQPQTQPVIPAPAGPGGGAAATPTGE